MKTMTATTGKTRCKNAGFTPAFFSCANVLAIIATGIARGQAGYRLSMPETSPASRPNDIPLTSVLLDGVSDGNLERSIMISHLP